MNDEWVETTLGDVAEWGAGGTPKAGDPKFYEGGTVPWAVIADVQDGYLSVTEKCITEAGLKKVGHSAPAGSVLVTMYGTIGRVAITTRPMATNQAIAWATPDTNMVSAEFLFYWLRNHQPELDRQARGATQRNINRAILKHTPITLPPIAVQRRIVDLMAHLDNHLANLRAAAKVGDRLEAQLIARLLDDVTDLRFQELGSVGEFIRGRRFTKADYVPEGLGCIHYGQVHTHFGAVATEVVTHVPEAMRSRLRLARTGDVVIAATSEDFVGLGKATVWLGDQDVAVHDDCYIFRHQLDPKYATYVIASPWFQQQKQQYGGGTKVTRISASDLAKIKVPVPPYEVQVGVGQTMAALTVCNAAAWKEVRAVETLRAAVLESLLTRNVVIPNAYDRLIDEVA